MGLRFFFSLLCLTFAMWCYAMSSKKNKPMTEKEVAYLLSRTDYSLSQIDTIDFISSLLNCITPQQFGAKGDGIADDTEPLRQALYESDKQGRVLYFPSGFKYKVIGSLNYYQGKYRNYTLNMIGSIPVKKGSYIPSEYGGIIIGDNVSVFKNATIRGSIKTMCFTGKRKDNVRFFDNCTCSDLVIAQSNFAEFGSFFYDTSINQVCQIISNTFLTVFYFARNEHKAAGMTDCTIAFNYINGGKEKNDNACFEWNYFNGSLITNNFIDYYRTIYYPYATTTQIFVSPVSSNNHYQVFRYFYAPRENIHNIFFYSYGDAFNWMDPTSDEVLARYKPFTYIGDDGNVYEIPPYIARCGGPWNITIKGAKIEQHMSSLVYIGGTVTEYEGAVFDVEFCGNNKYAEGQIKYKEGSSNPIYNNGKYKQNKVVVSGIIEKIEKLPNLNIGWSSSINGRRVLCQGDIYTATNIQEGSTWKSVWKKECEE